MREGDQFDVRFFEVVEHPMMGAARYDSSSARFSNGPHPYNRTPGPLLGEHNDELPSALGCTAAEIARLRGARHRAAAARGLEPPRDVGGDTDRT